jgi:lipopolysaccharide heptosyltransferase II
MKILIIRMSSLGDILLTFPVIDFLIKKYPGVQIDYIIKKEYAEVFNLYQGKFNLIPFDTASGFKGLKELKKKIRKNKYDIILDLHNNLRSIYLRLFQKARKGVFRKLTFKKQLLVKFKINLFGNVISIKERYLAALGNIIKLNPDDFKSVLEFGLPEFPERVKDKIVIDDNAKLIGLCPSARHFTKRFPTEKYIELGKKINEKYNADMFLFGDGEDYFPNEVIRLSIEGHVSNIAGNCTLYQTAYYMSKCDLIITNDTGLMHLANLLDKNIIALFGSTVKEFGFFPTGKNVNIIQIENLKCRPCSHIGRNKCPKGHFRCMNDIDTSDILNKFIDVL